MSKRDCTQIKLEGAENSSANRGLTNDDFRKLLLGGKSNETSEDIIAGSSTTCG